MNHRNLPQAGLEERVIYSQNTSVLWVSERRAENLNHRQVDAAMSQKSTECGIHSSRLSSPSLCLYSGTYVNVSVCVICHLCFSLSTSVASFCVLTSFSWNAHCLTQLGKKMVTDNNQAVLSFLHTCTLTLCTHTHLCVYTHIHLECFIQF